MNTIYIGVGHRARQGKDSFCRAIQKGFPDYDIGVYGFSDDLKKEVNGRELEMCIQYGVIFDMNPDLTDPFCNGPHGKQPYLLQFWGQKRRQEDAFYWIHKLDQRIQADSPQFALIKDLRQMNEYGYIRSKDGLYVKVEREGYVATDRDNNHPTETALADVEPDVHIKATSPEDLQVQAVQFFSNILSYLNQSFSTADFYAS